ncbi:hypothetical protein JOC70_001328 [Clostridium pascui]|uniref:DUF2922 domain-containing protein n=1 Tax=Clostridium pascui TaxID=46609 RepID=UPI00195D7943|nr:DUF2922 domain-containing protein [Clostridium pascui]MBM7869858.1 hypothetical protein [Clostridium pascui]
MAKSLVLSFVNVGGKKTSITVNNIKDAVTPAEANTLMDTIVAQNVFETKDGDLVSKSGAYVVDREKTEIEL